MRAASITPRPIEWAWHPYIPRGKLTAVAGQMGQAKSLLTIYLAAAITTARLDADRPQSVVMLNAEDDVEDTIRPRLEAAGADLGRIWIEPEITLDADHLAAVCGELGDVALIAVDPIQAYLPGTVNSWKGQDVRLALEPVRQLSAARGLATLLVQHLNRRSDAADPLARIADSQGIPQLARSVLLWGADPSDPDGDQGVKKALTRAKGNLARSGASATFTIVERTISGGITAPTLVRGTDREITAEAVVADPETRSATEEAAEWLRVQLADGPLAANEVKKRAERDQIAPGTLRRGKSRAGVVSEQARENDLITGWLWRLKGPNGPNKTVEHLDHLEQLDHLDQGDQGDQHDQHLTSGRPLAAASGEAA